MVRFALLIDAATGGDAGSRLGCPFRRADGTARFGVRSVFTTALRGSAMVNSPSLFAPEESIRLAAFSGL